MVRQAHHATVRRAWLVLGPECSGTRLWTTILMAGGCTGSADHSQWWDEHEFEEEDELVVWRRSFPHGSDRGWPDVGAMVARLQAAGYAVRALVTTREPYAMASSQVKNGYSGSMDEALEKIGRSYAMIFDVLYRYQVPVLVETYEGLVRFPLAVQARLAELARLPEVPCVLIKDGNGKHYD